MVDSTKGRNIDGLSANGTGGSDTGGVLTGAAIDNGVDGNLDGVLVRGEVDDREGVVDDADSHEFLSVVTTVHHQRVGKALNDWALSLAESLYCITAGGVGEVDGGTDVHVIARMSWYLLSASSSHIRLPNDFDAGSCCFRPSSSQYSSICTFLYSSLKHPSKHSEGFPTSKKYP